MPVSTNGTIIQKFTIEIEKDNKITETEVYVITLNYEGKMSADGKIERTESKVEGSFRATIQSSVTVSASRIQADRQSE